MSAEDKFAQIAEDTIQRANAVKCSVSDYVDGLRAIRDEVELALSAAESDLKQQKQSKGKG